MDNQNQITVLNFNGNSYPCRFVTLVNGTTLCVATQCLEDVLLELIEKEPFDDTNRELIAKAELLDNSIAYYVDENEMQFSDAELLCLIYN